jgi:hypothetical protein
MCARAFPGRLAHPLVESIDLLLQLLIQGLELATPMRGMRRQDQGLERRLPVATPERVAAPQALAERHGLKRVLHARPHPDHDDGGAERPQSCSSVDGIQIAGNRCSVNNVSSRPASRRSCFCRRVSAFRIFAGCPTRHVIPSSSINRKNQPIDPVASMPTSTGAGNAA